MTRSLPSSTDDETEASGSDGDNIGILGMRVDRDNQESPVPRRRNWQIPPTYEERVAVAWENLRPGRRTRHADVCRRMQRARTSRSQPLPPYDSSESDLEYLFEMVRRAPMHLRDHYIPPPRAPGPRRPDYSAGITEHIVEVGRREPSFSPPRRGELPIDSMGRSGPIPDDYVPRGMLLTREENGPDTMFAPSGMNAMFLSQNVRFLDGFDPTQHQNPNDEVEPRNTVPRQVVQNPIEVDEPPPRDPVDDFMGIVREVAEAEGNAMHVSDDEDDRRENNEEVQLPFPPPPGNSSSEDEDDEEADGDDEAELDEHILEAIENTPQPQVDAIVDAHIASIDEVRNMPRAPSQWRRGTAEGSWDTDDDEENQPSTSTSLPVDNRIHAFLSDLESHETQSVPGSDTEAREVERLAIERQRRRPSLEDNADELEYINQDAQPVIINLSPQAQRRHRGAWRMVHQARPPRQEEPPAEPEPNPPAVEEYSAISFSAAIYLLFILFFILPYLLHSSSPPKAPMVYTKKIRGFYISSWGYAELFVLNVNFVFLCIFAYEVFVAHLIQIPHFI